MSGAHEPGPDLLLEFRSDPACVVLHITGPIEPESGVRWIRIVEADARWSPGLPLVFDMSRADFSDVDSDLLRQYLMHARSYAEGREVGDPTLRVALVAPTDLAFGLARVFEAHASQVIARPRGVFRDLGAALDWVRPQEG